MKGAFSVLRGGALRRTSRVAEPTVRPESELLKMWEIDTEEYAVATGIPLEDVRDRVMTFEQWLMEQGFSVQAEEEAALTPERIIQYQKAIAEGEETLRTGVRNGITLGPNERADLEDSLAFWRRRLEEQGFIVQAQAGTLEDLRQAIEKEWAWRGKYLAPSGLSGNETKGWVIDLDLTAGITRQIEHGDIELGRHIVKGFQYGAADVRNKVKIETKAAERS